MRIECVRIECSEREGRTEGGVRVLMHACRTGASARREGGTAHRDAKPKIRAGPHMRLHSPWQYLEEADGELGLRCNTRRIFTSTAHFHKLGASSQTRRIFTNSAHLHKARARTPTHAPHRTCSAALSSTNSGTGTPSSCARCARRLSFDAGSKRHAGLKN